MSALTEDDWTQEKYIQLIRQFRARPMLWDQLNPLYYKKRVQSGAWENIAHVLNNNPKECKRKMNRILLRFKIEETKLIETMTNKSGDSTLKFTSDWFAFKEMAFMFDIDAERKRQSEGLIGEDNEEYVSINMDSIKQKYQHLIKTDSKGIINTPLGTINKEKSKPGTDASTSCNLSDNDEEINSFTSFIGYKMKKYTDVTMSAVEQAICDIIFQADQNCYENTYNKRIDKDTFPRFSFDTDHHKEIKEDSVSDSD